MNRPLRVAIDLRPLALDSGGGVGLLVAQIVEELTLRNVAFTGIADREIPPGRVPPSIPVWSAAGSGGRIRWESLVLPGVLRGIDPAPDLFHATWNHGVPGGLPFPSLLSLHDLIPWRAPRYVPWPRPAWLHRALYRRAVRTSAHDAARIVTLSEASRRDIESALPEARAKIEVIPCAVPRGFAAAPPEAVAAQHARFGGPYWLYLGGFDPRKGVDTLLDALLALEAQGETLPPIVLAGALRGEARALKARAEPLGSRIHFPGFVPEAELPALYAGAALFLYPSRAEGFGIPPLLAMASGVPVVAADSGAVTETLGGTGIVVPPGDAAALAAALRSILRDPAPLTDLRARGRARAAAFTVEALASRMRAAYERAASRP
ncbi:MAG TPA: glycosyltransferase family 1 protein [Candidatus Omnitrophota bacterium]|nr:glycosyltransferase family 1 protein [Candidatus Omnitrophota bacterium]